MPSTYKHLEILEKNKRIKSVLFFCFILLFIIYSCKTYHAKNTGLQVYKNTEKPCLQLHLKKDRFYYISDCENPNFIARFVCCDTIAGGTYVTNNKIKMLELSSDYMIRNNVLKVFVKEKIHTGLKDSIAIYIDNPIYDLNGHHEPLMFEIELLGMGRDQNRYRKDGSSYMTFKSIKNLYGISLNIYPKLPDVMLSNIGITGIELFEGMYSVEDPNSNVFEISIPDLTYDFLTLKRLDKDYVQIIDNDKLLWDGVTYKKVIDSESK